MNYIPLKNHSDFSLLRGINRPHQIAQRIRECGYSASALIDNSSLAGSVKIQKSLKEACKSCGYPKDVHNDAGKCMLRNVQCSGYDKNPIKSIIGCEFNISRENASIKEISNKGLTSLAILAKNRTGWTNLAKATSAANSSDNFYHKPRLSLNQLSDFSKGEFICLTGAPGTDLADFLFNDPNLAYKASTYEQARSFAKPWGELKNSLLSLGKAYLDMFGPENVFFELDLLGQDTFPAKSIVGKTIKWLAKELNVKLVATNNSYYSKPIDALDHHIILCSSLNSTLEEVKNRELSWDLNQYFKSKINHIPSYEELAKLYSKEELENTLLVSEMCENYDITSKPKLPKFLCPNGLNPEQYLLELCRKGWKKKLEGKVEPEKVGEYGDRVKRELGVLNGVGLAEYFLIIEDIMNFAHNELKCLPSPGRGSAAGCLVSYLLDITDCDPIKYNLSFERFYNPGRNTGDNVSLPDIDCDFPITKRESVIEWIRKKYGEDRVAQIATFGRIKGKGSVKEVMRAYNWGTYGDRNKLVAPIPDDAAISDQLQSMMEDSGQSSCILWTLENKPEEFEGMCKLEEDGSISGPLGKYFEQAVRLEGIKKSQGKHAAGIIISNDVLADSFPMIFDKSSGRSTCGMEHGDVEACGLMKLDVLGLAVLSKMEGCINTIATGVVTGE